MIPSAQARRLSPRSLFVGTRERGAGSGVGNQSAGLASPGKKRRQGGPCLALRHGVLMLCPEVPGACRELETRQLDGWEEHLYARIKYVNQRAMLHPRRRTASWSPRHNTEVVRYHVLWRVDNGGVFKGRTGWGGAPTCGVGRSVCLGGVDKRG